MDIFHRLSSVWIPTLEFHLGRERGLTRRALEGRSLRRIIINVACRLFLFCFVENKNVIFYLHEKLWNLVVHSCTPRQGMPQGYKNRRFNLNVFIPKVQFIKENVWGPSWSLAAFLGFISDLTFQLNGPLWISPKSFTINSLSLSQVSKFTKYVTVYPQLIWESFRNESWSPHRIKPALSFVFIIIIIIIFPSPIPKSVAK